MSTDQQTLLQIEDWYWPYWGEAPANVPIHVLTGENDWRMAAWMLASFFRFTESAWPIVFHDDGTLSSDARRSLENLFEHSSTISRAEADAKMNRVLRAYPYCHEYRLGNPLGLRIFDTACFEPAERYLVLDSDVLFFQRPDEIMDWADDPFALGCWFNRDAREFSNVSDFEAREELGVSLWPRVDSGIGLIHRPVIDLAFCDRALATTAILRGAEDRIEQTLFALCASRGGPGGLLPNTYEVSLKGRASPDAVSRHYVPAVRNRYFTEGLKLLREPVLVAELD
ncbi:MAG: hypothetical protein ABI680_18275 [Chthoniobacteraceae bacterium]